MSNLYWLNEGQMSRLRPFFPKSHGRPRVDDRRVLCGIIFVLRNGLRWCDAPREYGPGKTLYNRWNRWCHKGIFAQILEGLSSKLSVGKTIMMDATYLKAHRTASSLRLKRGCWTPDRSGERWHEYQIARRHRCTGSPHQVTRHGGANQRLHRSCGLNRNVTEGRLASC